MGWFTLWTKLSAADGGDCSDEKKRAEVGYGDDWETTIYEGKSTEIKELRNRRMVHRDISIILDRIEALTPEERERQLRARRQCPGVSQRKPYRSQLREHCRAP